MQQVAITDTMVEEMTYFCDGNSEVQTTITEEMIKKNAIALLFKRSSENLPNAIDDVVDQMVYGNSRQPPGDGNSPYQKLLLKQQEDLEFSGIWTPPNQLCKAMALKWLFPAISGPFRLEEETPIPPHLVVGYDAFKYKDVMELGAKYQGAVMKYGFFTSDIPGEGVLITKTVDKFEKRTTPPTYDEKIVIQLEKNPEWFDEFLDLGPSYMSSDTVLGEDEAKVFFPATYDIPEEIIMEIKKKPKRKGKSKLLAVVEAHENEILQSDKETVTEAGEDHNSVGEDAEGTVMDEEKNVEEEEEGEEGEAVEEIDKATSPIEDNNQLNQ